MEKRKRNVAAALLVLCMLLGSTAPPVRAANPGGVKFLNTYVNTGNQRRDILGVALTQLGYEEKYENDTKYGDWCGYPYQPWCAAFVSWCARQADISTGIIKKNARAHPDSFQVPYYHGENYTPQPGDLFFTESFSHVGLVWYVEGEFFYCIEGNGKYHDYTVPDDPEVDSYHVMTNKRLIRDHYFGVPAYKGCDKAHTYIKGHDAAHPHFTYYHCTTCKATYYTGYTQVLGSCTSCFPCGCGSSGAGYYLVSADKGPIKLRAGHNTSAKYSGYVASGEAVYVHGMNSKNGWAYVEYDGQLGHIQTKYLQKYCAVPAAPTVTAEKAQYLHGESVTVNWNAPANTEQYRLQVLRDGTQYAEENMELRTRYTLQTPPAGEYEIRVIACNRSGASVAGVAKFTVRQTYTVTYDARGGSGAPGAQTQKLGQTHTVSSTAPTRTGYTFLGWTEDSKSAFANYAPGTSLSSETDITLYAVWKLDTSGPKTIQLEKRPARTVFLLGEPLDTTGLTLRMTYTDGSGHTVTQGYSTEGFSSDAYGTKTVTVCYATLTLSYDVQVAPYIPGDIDLNKLVNRDDVMQLLWHISFPDKFTVFTPVDFNRDGTVNRDDVMQLLWHATFPDRFPLEVVWPDAAEGETQ